MFCNFFNEEQEEIKMKRKIGVILAALVVIGGGIFYAQHKVQVEAMSTEGLVEEIALPLSLLTEENITQIFIEDTSRLVLEKQNDIWKNPSETEIAYNSELVDEWINYFQTEQSINIIRNVEDLAIYGITETTPCITITSSEGKSQTFRLGNINAEHTIRYIYSDETELVYSVSPTKSEVLLVDSSKLIDPALKIPNLENIKTLTIEQTGTTFKLQKRDDKWFLVDYFNDDYEVKPEVVMGILEALGALEKQSFVGKMTEEQSFGMTTPSLVITLDEKYVLNINSAYYLTENNVPYVYTIKEGELKDFEQLKPLHMMHRQVYRPVVEEVESIVMTNPQNVYKLKLEENLSTVQTPAQGEETLQDVLSSHMIGTLNEMPLDLV